MRRTMSKMSEMTFLAAKQALAQSDIGDLNDYDSLIIAGSTTGSPETLEEYFRRYAERNGPEGQLSTSFFKIMNHERRTFECFSENSNNSWMLARPILIRALRRPI